ncbi:hypothetical protein BKA58DRAFT_406832 [Alternaria rosae]|uniref:uncharacterized protein n=1 Tax=Alternaria rosae TaxID=1187941 RepID=UPI001E8D5229|nr:uncharacterized protein BKA58DRAFT_406832 [Alternaria rosae]KAH6838685.1 hypothetical protein BKA58DRAFT_406832 [Alternaria rosae]
MFANLAEGTFNDTMNDPGLPYAPHPKLQQHLTPNYVQQVRTQTECSAIPAPSPTPTPTAGRYIQPAQVHPAVLPTIGLLPIDRPSIFSTDAVPRHARRHGARAQN